ncbi:MAG TPA: hypothetical protein P5107_05350 [Thermotogota bacterium]|nr:hypothetical protein [Thermotogota bacterium]HPF16475.1 hypothetical protein [Thermotogota bacterium]HRW34463.1 hypothetical protein [Thermotogota bacterium]
MTKELLEKIREIETKMGKVWAQQFEGITKTEELIKKAKENGIELTPDLAEEGLKIIEANEKNELSEEELSAVAGGKICVR